MIDRVHIFNFHGLKLAVLCLLGALVSLPGCSLVPTMRASAAPVEDLEDSVAAPTSSENQPPSAVEESDVQVRPLLGPGASQPARPPRVGEGASTAPRSGSAVVALLDNAGQQTRSGNLDAAAAALERALRLEPRNPEVWSRLAGIRLQQGQFDQAINLASKSNSLSGNTTTLVARNNRIIAQAKQQMDRR